MERRTTMRRVGLTLLLVLTLATMLACREPTVEVLRFCGVDTLPAPVAIAGTTYTQRLVLPRRCDDATDFSY